MKSSLLNCLGATVILRSQFSYGTVFHIFIHSKKYIKSLLYSLKGRYMLESDLKCTFISMYASLKQNYLKLERNRK
jgi:HEPN domain-containing protein